MNRAHRSASDRAGHERSQSSLSPPVGDHPLRDHRGRFLPRLRETPEGSCEFLLWSRYHGAWHRRGSAGGANGYTTDIAEAGLFSRAVAWAYNSYRDRPYHVSEKRKEIAAAIEMHDRKLQKLRSAMVSA